MAICPNCGEENPDKFRLCGFCGTPLAPALPAQEVRKTVTIVFSDLKGSTAMGEKLDSEAVREVMSRYFDEMRDALERHGGTVEKYIGDAIMAVFGLPRVHEDDALRAVRAAAEMRERLAALNEELDRRWGVTVGNRTGVNTGEVVAGDPTTGQRLVTGDTVNTAARLEQAAPPSDVLIGETTYRLVRHAVEVEEVEPLELKGKAERVPAYRLVSVHEAESVERRHDSPLVGRTSELGVLRDELRSAVGESSCRLVTVVAQAGVGKSRLLEEFVQSAQPTARILRGRCLPYGRGITFWPLVEIVRDAAGIRDEDPPEVGHSKLLDIAGPGGEDAVERVASAVGLAGTDFPLDEVFWGTRKLLELQAAKQPVVVVFEDIHWAESAFLDLIEHVRATAAAPLLLLCAARPELLEHRPNWSEHGPLFELQPLSEEESAEVIEHLLGDAAIPEEVRTRIITAAEGNPLFVQQVLSMMIDDRLLRREDGRWIPTGDLSNLAIPGSIQALLAARLDLLTLEERAVIEPASVIGHVFEEPPVVELAPEAVRADVGTHFVAMTQKQLVRREREESDYDYRFHHILIRDAAYQGILKRARATMHEQFVNWAEEVNRERDRQSQFDEILGYHLEQAYQYLSELGPLDDHGQELGRRSASLLGRAGRRAFARGDMAAAANLLRRAAALLPEHDSSRLDLLPDLGEAMMEIGEFAWAEVFLDEALAGASATGDETLRADARLTQLLVQHHAAEDLRAWRENIERETSALIPVLEDRAADRELAKAWRMVAFLHATVCLWEAAASAQQRALEYARAAGDRRQEARLSSAYAYALCDGPTPVPAAIARCEEMLARNLGHKQSEAIVLCSLATLLALDGKFDEARAMYVRARTLLEDLGAAVFAASTSLTSARVELLAGNATGAETELRRDYERLEAMGELYFRPLVAGLLAQVLFIRGAADEAQGFAATAEQLAADDDVELQALLRALRAHACAERGSMAEAVATAREGVAILPETEAPVIRAEALLGLAQLLDRAGDATGAEAVLDEAATLCAVKQMRVLAERTEALRAAILPKTAARAV
jgi:class 3 adenylate cyclase/ATP/maltotriose-dependent transcriptional regulator MalT